MTEKNDKFVMTPSMTSNVKMVLPHSYLILLCFNLKVFPS